MGRPGLSGLLIRSVAGVFFYLLGHLSQPLLGAVAWPIYWAGLVLLFLSALQLVIMLLGALMRAVRNRF